MRRLALLLCLIFAAGAQAQTSALQSLEGDYESASWKAVGRIDFGRGAFCSGTLIAPDLVLTAAHCLYHPDTGQPWATSDITFHAGLRNGAAVASRAARDAAAHALFVPDGGITATNIAYDVALIRLETPISTFEVPPFQIHDNRIETGPVSVVSYGRNRSQAQSRQKACNMLARQGDAMIFDCDVTFGSSGSPVFSHKNGRGRIISVISGMIEVDGDKRALGMVLPARIDELRAQLRMQTVTPTAKPRRITVGGSSTRTGTGAKFVRP